MIDHDNLEGFADAENYDRANDDEEGKLGAAFYLAQALQQGGPVLDVGCGTGRVALQMAQAGLSVTGIDVTPGMLAVARRKTGMLPVRWVEADARDFALGERFHFIFMTGNVFQAFISRAEQEAVLRAIHSHLTDAGRLVFEVRNPRWARAVGDPAALGQREARYDVRGGFFANLESDAVERPSAGYRDGDGNAVTCHETQAWDHASQVLHITSWRRWSAQGAAHAVCARTALRYTFPQEMRMLLEYNGYVVDAQYGDWDGSELTAQSINLITTCRRA